MSSASDCRQSGASAVESSLSLIWEDVLRLHGVTRMPGDEDPFMRDFILRSTEELLHKYGEDWIREYRESLLSSAEYLASLL